MKNNKLTTERSLLKVLFFSVITLGIYDLFFLHRLAKDVNTVCYEDEKRTSGIFALVILSVLTLGIYQIFWWYRIAHLISAAQRRAKMNNVISPGFVLLCAILCYTLFTIPYLVIIHQTCNAMNDLCYSYNFKLDNPDVAQ